MVSYPGDWEVKRLDEIGKWESGSTPSRNNPAYYMNGNIFWVKNTDLNDGILKSSEEKITEEALKENFLKIKKPGTILIAMYCGDTVGKLAILDIFATTNQNCCACEVFEDYYNKFIFYSLLFRRKEIQGLSLSGGLSHISKKIIINYSIPLPPLNEQIAISDTLAAFDTHITNLTELISKKKAIREGALEDLMSGRTRLKGFSGNWEVILLGSKCEITSSKRVFESEWKQSGIPFLRTRDIANFHAGIEQRDKLFISEETYKKKIAVSGELQKGDLLVTGVGTIGLPFIVATDEKLYFKDGNIIWVKQNKNINPKFLYYLFLSTSIQAQIKNFCGFTTVGTFTIQNAKKIKIPLPTLPEQIAIADTLTALDSEIQALESERDKISQIRDGAMNDLLTGKVRLIHGK